MTTTAFAYDTQAIANRAVAEIATMIERIGGSDLYSQRDAHDRIAALESAQVRYAPHAVYVRFGTGNAKLVDQLGTALLDGAANEADYQLGEIINVDSRTVAVKFD